MPESFLSQDAGGCGRTTGMQEGPYVYCWWGRLEPTGGIGIRSCSRSVRSRSREGGVKRYLGALVKSGSEEGFQEGLQQLLENMSKYGILGKDPGDITSEVGGNALIGAVLGMGMAGGAHLPTLVTGRGGSVESGIPVPNTAIVTPETIEEQVRAGNIPGVVAPTNDPTVPPPSGPSKRTTASRRCDLSPTWEIRRSLCRPIPMRLRERSRRR